MEVSTMKNFIKEVLENKPTDWLNLTTHRLDIYNEELAKSQFLAEFKNLFDMPTILKASALKELPTAYDYIRLGHPLSCVLEWAIANLNNLKAKNVISFSSKTAPILAVLRSNLLANKNTQIIYTGELPLFFDAKVVQQIYGYDFDLKQVADVSAIPAFNGSTIFISQQDEIGNYNLSPNIDFLVGLHHHLGSVILVNGEQNENYISEIQHVRRRETIAMTPANCLGSFKTANRRTHFFRVILPRALMLRPNTALVLDAIKEITGTTVTPAIASSGLSMQYAIVMGLVHDAMENHKGKAVKIVIPPNCYGGTNDQARRVAACIDNVEIVDLPVDGGNDMVKSIDTVLSKIASDDAIPYIIAEIPTNPRVEVPDLIALKEVLGKST